MTVGAVHRIAGVDDIGTQLTVDTSQVELPQGPFAISKLIVTGPNAAVVTKVFANDGRFFVTHGPSTHGSPAAFVVNLHTSFVGASSLRKCYQRL